MKIVRLSICVAILILFSLNSKANEAKREYYQLTVYQFRDTTQERLIDEYLSKAYLPALHKRGIKSIGVFKPIANDTAKIKIVYVLVPFKTLDQAKDLPGLLMKDNEYLKAAKIYLDADYKSPVYQRIEKILMQAFEMAPKMQLPQLSSSVKDKVYELRNYESASEKYNISKEKMFQAGGELDLFKKLNFNAVFYAHVIAGSHMPNLMYMTSFENMEQREAHWKAFFDSAEWKTLKALPEYQNNVSKAEVILTKATAYSDY